MAVIFNLCDVDSLHRAEVYVLALLLLLVEIVVHIDALDSEQTTLHHSVFLQIGHHFVHDCRWDCESVAAVASCL